MERDVGTMGESQFLSYCSASGMVANKSSIDRFGWDYVVEIAGDYDQNIPADLVEPVIDCKIQIKSTDGKPTGVQIELSNLKKLCDSPTPSFILFLEFDGLDVAQRGFLKHIDEDFMHFTYEKVRQWSNQGKRLRDHKPVVKYDKSIEITPLTGINIRNAITAFVPDGLYSYVTNKSKIIKTIGYESGSKQISFSITGSDALERIQQHSLGMLDQIEIENIEIKHKRFGHITEQPIASAVKGLLKLSPVTETATAKFRTTEYSAPLEFFGTFFNSPWNPIIEKAHRIYRFYFPHINVVFRPSDEKLEITFDPNPSHKSTLKQFVQFMKLVEMMNQHKELYIELQPGLRKPFTSKTNIDHELKEYEDLINLSKLADDICRDFNQEPSEINITLSNLIKNAVNTCVTHELIFQPASEFDFTISVSSSDETYPEEIENVALLTFGRTLIGSSKLFTVFIAFIGILKKVEGQIYHMVATDKIIDHKLVLTRDRDESQQAIEASVALFREKLEATYDEIIPIALKPIEGSSEQVFDT